MWRAFCKTLLCLFPFSPGPVTSSPLSLSLFIYLVLWIPYLNFCDSREQQPPARPSQGMPHLPSACEFFTGIKKYQYLTLPPHTTQKAGTHSAKSRTRQNPPPFPRPMMGDLSSPQWLQGQTPPVLQTFPCGTLFQTKASRCYYCRKKHTVA